jgi:hypothetical protein
MTIPFKIESESTINVFLQDINAKFLPQPAPGGKYKLCPKNSSVLHSAGWPHES